MLRPNIFALLCFVLVGAASASASAQQLNVVLSCPTYDPGTGAGNNPAAPSEPQTWVLDVSGKEPITCQVRYGNTSGGALSNVTFTLNMAKLQIPYVATAALPGGDPMLSVLHPMDNALVQQGPAPEFNLSQAGFPAGVYDPAAATYTWTIPSLSAGQTGELRVGAYPRYLDAGKVYTLKLEARVAGTVVATRTAPFSIAKSYLDEQPPLVRVPTITDRANGFLTGTATTEQRYLLGTSNRAQDYDQELIVYLPWVNMATGQVHTSGFDQFNQSHRPLHIIDALRAEATLRSYDGARTNELAYYALMPGQFGSPNSGANQGRVLRYDVASNSVRLRYGAYGITPPVISWSAPRDGNTPIPAGISTLPTRVCHKSYNTRTQIPAAPELCATQSSALGAEPNNGDYDLSADLNVNNYHNEANPLLPYSPITMQVRVGNKTSRPTTDADIYFQLPGDSRKRANFIEARSYGGELKLTPEPRPFSGDAIYVSTAMPPYGSEQELFNRVIPFASAAQWKRCDNAIAAEPAGVRCTAAHLAAIGVNPNQVSEVRFHVARLDNFSALAAPVFQVDAKLDGTARSSIDGVDISNNHDMRNASVGTPFVFKAVGPTGSPNNILTAGLAEVMGGSRLEYYDTQPRGGAYTTEARAEWQIHFRNRGPGAVQGPFIVKMKMPPTGYEIDNTNAFPGQPFKPRITAAYHIDQTAPADASTLGALPPGDYSASWDAATNELTVTITLASSGGTMTGILDPGVRPLNVPSDLVIALDGFVRIGAPRLLSMQSVTVQANVLEGDGVTRTSKTITASTPPFMNVINIAPSLHISGVATPDPVPGYGVETIDYTISNAAYLANGQQIANGATGSARAVALYHQVTRTGDYGLTGATTFETASSPDAAAIWVRTNDPTAAQKGDAASLTTANGWRRCSTINQTCNATKLAGLNIMPAQVRWVAFDMGEALVTDAQPRGVAPRGGAMRVENPYRATVQVRDAGSAQGVILRAQGELKSGDTAPTTTALTALDVVVNAACDTRDPLVGPGKMELCDGIDNNCDGQIDEGFPLLGTMCDAGLGPCKNTAPVICAPNKMGTICSAMAGQPMGQELCDGLDNDCDGMTDEGFPGVGADCMVDGGGGCMVPGASACSADGAGIVCAPLDDSDMDDDGVLDACDCAPGDETRWSMAAGVAESCDKDQDGACDGMIVGPNPTLCPVAGDCDDDDPTRAPGLAELCDGIDQSCDGMTDEGFPGVDMSCMVDAGGGCMVPGVGACSADGAGIVCVAADPSDTDNDGVLDACDCAPGDETRWSMAAGVAESCDRDQDGACDAAITAPNTALCLVTGDCDDDDPARSPGATEVCDEVDNNCDGEADETFVAQGLGQSCQAGVGACTAQGTLVCGADGLRCDAQPGSPGDEVCDEVDNDCDGEVDEGEGLCVPPEPPTPPSVGAQGDGLIACQAAPGAAPGAAWMLWWLAFGASALRRRRRMRA
jgi:hypothetical protein